MNYAGFAERLTLMARAVKAKPACQHHGRSEDLSAVMGQNLFARLG